MNSNEPGQRRASANVLFKRGLLVPAGLLSLALATACGDGGPATPTAPSEPSSTTAVPPKPPPQGTATPFAAGGSITMVSSSPASGASLAVAECRFGSVTRRCADGWQGSFDVSLSRQMDWPVLTVAFFDGEVLCGYAADAQQRLPAGQTVTFRPTWISLSDEFGTFSSPCPLPATTTRIVVTLWSDADWTTPLTQEFAAHYTFIRQ